jgi:poly(A) polymerase
MTVSLPELTSQYDALFDAWERAGHELYVVGGCVRDVVMGLDQVGDVDLATDATPEETSEILSEHGWKVIPIGARFGTIATLFHGEQVEITTYRVAEEYEPTSRKPTVVFGSRLEDDLSRRDLSINAMAAGRGGRIVDPFNGHQAIKDQILEVPGGGLGHTESILRDDPLRLLRIARFAGRLGFSPTNETTAAARKTASELENISHERWKMELDKLLVAKYVAAGLHWLNEVRALEVILPDAANFREADEDSGMSAMCDVLDAAPPDPIVRWAILRVWLTLLRESGQRPDYARPLSPVDSEVRVADAEYTARDFRFSNDERHALRFLVGSECRLDAIRPPWTRKRLRRWVYEKGEYSEQLIEYIAALSCDERVDDWRAIALDSVREAATHEDTEPNLPDGFGRDVIETFQLDRGPKIAQAIDYLKGAIIDGELENGGSVQAYLAFLSRHEAKWRHGE